MAEDAALQPCARAGPLNCTRACASLRAVVLRPRVLQQISAGQDLPVASCSSGSHEVLLAHALLQQHSLVGLLRHAAHEHGTDAHDPPFVNLGKSKMLMGKMMVQSLHASSNARQTLSIQTLASSESWSWHKLHASLLACGRQEQRTSPCCHERLSTVS